VIDIQKIIPVTKAKKELLDIIKVRKTQLLR
jgi:hypothetical protein